MVDFKMFFPWVPWLYELTWMSQKPPSISTWFHILNFQISNEIYIVFYDIRKQHEGLLESPWKRVATLQHVFHWRTEVKNEARKVLFR